MKRSENLLSVCMAALVALLCGCSSPVQKKEEITKAPEWERIGPGGGGFNYIPTFSYSSPENFLIRCNMTGSYLTTNGGLSYAEINFPNGGSSYAYDPKDSSTVYIGSASLNRSTDGGKTWSQLFPKKEDVRKEIFEGDEAEYRMQVADTSLYQDKYQAITAIRVDPVDPSSIYFCIKNRFYFTTDNGHTFHKEDLADGINFIYTNAAIMPGEVYIFTASALVIFNKNTKTFSSRDLPVMMSPSFSTSGGLNKNTGKPVFYALHYDTTKPYDGEYGSAQVWITEDMGLSWTKNADPLVTNAGNPEPSYSMISCAEFDAQQAYLISNLYQEKNKEGKMRYWYGAMKTGDAGRNWKWVWKGGGGSGQYGVKDGTGIANLSDAWAERAFGGEYIQLADVGVYPFDGNIAVVTDWYRTMKTTDGGASWKQVYSVSQPDGTFSSSGMDNTTTYGVHFDPFDSSHIAISYTDIGFQHSFNGGKSWKRSVEGVPPAWTNTCYWMVFDPKVKGRVWSAWSGMHDIPRGKMTRNPGWQKESRGGVCVSDDGGLTWKKSSEGMGDDSPVTCIVVDNSSAPGNRTLYAAVYGKGVFKSVDGGRNWSLKNRGIGKNTCAFEITQGGNGQLYLTVSPVPEHRNGKMGRDYYSGEVYTSADGAENWERLHISDGPLFPNGIEVDPGNPQRVYLACWSALRLSDLVGKKIALATGGNTIQDMPGGVFVSENSGKTWKQIFDKTKYVYDVTIDTGHHGRLYASTFNQGVYRSDDQGGTWKKIKGYDFQWSHRVIPDFHDPGKIYITTFGSSVWHGAPETE